MLELLLYSLTVAALLHLWFRTSFIAEYAHLFGVERWLGLHRLEEMAKTLKEGESLAYPAFLALLLVEKKNRGWNFLARGITCPNCLGLWVAFGVCWSSGATVALSAYALGLWFFRLLG